MGSLLKLCCHSGRWSQTSQVTVSVQVSCLWKTKGHRGISNWASSLLWCLMQPYEEASPTTPGTPCHDGDKARATFLPKEKFVESLPDAIYECSHSSKVLLVQIHVHWRVLQYSHSGVKMPAIVLIWRRCVFLKWPVAFRYFPRTLSSRTSFT